MLPHALTHTPVPYSAGLHWAEQSCFVNVKLKIQFYLRLYALKVLQYCG